MYSHIHFPFSQLVNHPSLTYGNEELAPIVKKTNHSSCTTTPKRPVKMCYGATCPDCCKEYIHTHALLSTMRAIIGGYPHIRLTLFFVLLEQQRRRGSDAGDTSPRRCRACPRRTGARVSPRWRWTGSSTRRRRCRRARRTSCEEEQLKRVVGEVGDTLDALGAEVGADAAWPPTLPRALGRHSVHLIVRVLFERPYMVTSRKKNKT